MSGHRSPGTALTWLMAVLVVALATVALTPNAIAAPRSQTGGSSPAARCAGPCPLQQRLADARRRHAETASLRLAEPATGAGAVRPDLKEPSGFEGTVTDAKTKSPVTGVEVCAYEIEAFDEGAYEEEELEPTCGLVVEATGTYRIGVKPGEYIVEFFDPEGTYLTQIFNGHPIGENKFDLVTVAAEALTKQVNAALSEGGAIEGTVTAASGGKPLEGIRVCAIHLDFKRCVDTADAGAYRIGGLPAGTYEVGFLVPEKRGYNYFDATRSGVKVMLATATTGVDAALKSGGEIDGTVTSAETGAPLVHDRVCAFLASAEEEFEKCAVTESDGSYAIELLPGGEYQVEFEEVGAFRNQFYAGVPRLRQATAFSVTAGGPAVTGIDAAMFEKEARITGHVASEIEDAPLGKVGVCAIAPPTHVIACTETSPEGNYTLEGLPEGSYAVEFKDPPDYRRGFSGGKATLAEATLIGVAFGGTAEANALLHLTGVHVEGAGSIEGRVTAQATGLPLGGAIVCADAATGKCEETASDGTYVIANLPEGEYTVEFKDGPNFLPEFYDEAASQAEATPVDIAGETKATGIDAKLRPVVVASNSVPAHVSTGSPAPPHGASGVLTTKIVVPSITAASAVRVSGRRATVKLHCAAGPCHGKVALTITVTRRHKAHGHTVVRRVQLAVGSGAFSLAPGASAEVTIHLTSQGRALLARVARRPRLGRLKLALQGAAARATAVTIR